MPRAVAGKAAGGRRAREGLPDGEARAAPLQEATGWMVALRVRLVLRARQLALGWNKGSGVFRRAARRSPVSVRWARDAIPGQGMSLHGGDADPARDEQDTPQQQ